MFIRNLTGMPCKLFLPPRLAHNLYIFTGAQTCRLIRVGFLEGQIFSRTFANHLMKFCIIRIMMVKIIIHICELLKMDSWQCLSRDGSGGNVICMKLICCKWMLAVSVVFYYLNYWKQIRLKVNNFQVARLGPFAFLKIHYVPYIYETIVC